MACWGTEPWWNRGRAQAAQVCARMPFFSCAVHARFMRELPPVFVQMLLRFCMTDDRESPSGRPSSNPPAPLGAIRLRGILFQSLFPSPFKSTVQFSSISSPAVCNLQFACLVSAFSCLQVSNMVLSNCLLGPTDRGFTPT